MFCIRNIQSAPDMGTIVLCKFHQVGLSVSDSAALIATISFCNICSYSVAWMATIQPYFVHLRA